MTARIPPEVALPLIQHRVERLADYTRKIVGLDPLIVQALNGLAADLTVVVEQLGAREVTL